MSLQSNSASRAVALRTLLALAAAFGAAHVSAAPARAQDADKQKQAKVSDGEAKLADSIDKAPDAAAKLAAAEEFLKKYPKSTLRQQIAEHVSSQVVSAPEDQRAALAERYLSLFNAAGEDEVVRPALIIAYANPAAKHLDDAFRMGAQWLEKNPNDALVLAVLSHRAVTQLTTGDQKYAQQALAYGPRALALFEADTRMPRYDDATWKVVKESWLPRLHQSLGLVALNTDKPAEALAHLEKAVALDPTDPVSLYLLATAKDGEYRQWAAQYQGMMPGAAKNELLTKINARLDEIVELYARAAAAADGQAQHQQMRQQIIEDMTSYYKFRHNGTTEGMQQLIDKYKKPPAQP
jgi:tetratricopeptide (TPR) repeat protein